MSWIDILQRELEREPEPFRLVLPRALYEQAIAEGFDPDSMIPSDGPVVPQAWAERVEAVRQRRGKGQRKAGRRTRWAGGAW